MYIRLIWCMIVRLRNVGWGSVHDAAAGHLDIRSNAWLRKKRRIEARLGRYLR